MSAVLAPLLISLAPIAAQAACERAMCIVPKDDINFTKLIDFEDVPASIGLGSRIDNVLVKDGARFGERFAGQSRSANVDFEIISGTPFNPLNVINGGAGETLGAMHVRGTIVLQGHGPRVYPSVDAVGEGAIAILFDRDQPALSFDIKGGEQGFASVQFLRRDGSAIDTLTIGPLSEASYGFARQKMQPNIAGILILNTDPQGIALDNLRFEGVDLMG